MTNASMITSFINRGTSVLDSSGLEEWAKLEQADIPKAAETATLKDAFAMVGYAKNGRSARDYIMDSCPYAKITKGLVTIEMDFYVWPSALDLPYWLTTSVGEISKGALFRRDRSFDVIFNSQQSVDIGFLFDGDFAQEMPFFDNQGHKLDPQPTVSIEGTNVVLSAAATGVLRATVTAKGYLHTLTIKVSETPVTKTDATTGDSVTLGGYDLDNLSATIMVVWGNCGHEDYECIESHRDILAMVIPACVGDLLNACDGNQSSTLTVNDDDRKYVVYFSACNGEILDQGWQDPQ